MGRPMRRLGLVVAGGAVFSVVVAVVILIGFRG